MNFAVMTPAVNDLLKSVFTTFSAIGPHLGLFIAVYFGFAGMGMSFVTQAMSTGGPGDWCSQNVNPQSSWPNGTCPLSVATDTPYGDCAYAGGTYYWKFLNFNGFVHSFYTLYVIMIQNNWSTVVDGASQVTTQYSRYFFVVYNVCISMVMTNILVGAIVDALTSINDEIRRDEEGVYDPLEVVCSARINCTVAPSGKFYGETWELGDIPLHNGVRYDTMLVPLFAKTSGRVAQLGRQQDLQRDIDALEAELDAIKKEAEEKEVNRHFQNPLRKGDRRGGRGAASPKVAPPAILTPQQRSWQRWRK